MLELNYQNKSLTIAENWNELEGKQIIQLMDVLHRGKTRLQQQIDALRILCGKSRIVFFMLKPEVVDAFLPYVDWVFKENTLTEQIIPAYDELHGPGREFCNLKMKEFHFAELYYKNFAEEQKAKDLNLLIATLYRPAKFKGKVDGVKVTDIRMPFDDAATVAIGKKVAEWPLALRQAILFWYDGCRQQLVELYDEVFSGGAESTNDEKAAYGIYGLMMDLAGDKLGTVQDIEELNVHQAMASLELMIINAREIEAQTPKA